MMSPECTRHADDRCRGSAAFDPAAEIKTPCSCVCHTHAVLTQIRRELSTARLLLAQFEAQLRAYDEHMAKGRAARRFDIRHELFDPTIIARLGGLRAGRAKWSARVDELVATLNTRTQEVRTLA